ncbi:MAG: sigma-70 family RNA polymerase sigma factor [Planctomycetes bacterium]|nr:sigma-70 family RNA polymerase sigma factor [Planctomycetota bacterium]
MPDPHDLDRELHQHAAALRGIARDLLRDGHAADDVTQATLQQAVARGELRPGPLGGWLRTVLVNFARQWRRSERRRVAREAALPPLAPAPSPADTLAHRETLQAVTDAVLQLDEPYQTTILLRYFEDLPPRTIAQRTHTSVATVKSRLQRGLALLRTRLDQQRRSGRDDWRLLLATTFGLPGAAATAGITVTTGAWLMGTTTKVLVAAGVVCVGGLFVFGLRNDPRPPAPDTGERMPAAATAVAAGATERAAGSTLREPALPAPSNEAWLDHPFTFELEVRVVDETGLPVQGFAVRFAPEHTRLHEVYTGPDGTVLLSWRSRRMRGSAVLQDGQANLVRVPLVHGRRAVRTIGRGALHPPRRRDQVPMLQAVPLTTTFDLFAETPQPTPGLHPHALFSEACAKTTAAADGPELTISESVTESIESAAEVAQHDGVTGTVLDATQSPAPGVPVVVFGSGVQPLDRTTTDLEGAFRFEDLAPGTFTVRAGGDGRGLATAPVTVTAGRSAITLFLLPGACVRGRVLQPDGAPIDGAIVTWRATDDSWWDGAPTSRDGTFTLANLPADEGVVAIWPPGDGRHMPTVVQVARTGGSDLVVTCDPASGNKLQLRPVPATAAAPVQLTMRLWNGDTGLGFEEAGTVTDEPWRLEHLPAGWYQLELFAPGSGWFDAGTHWLDGTTEVDLGRIVLPEPGTVQFAPRDGACEVCQLRADVDVRVQLAPVPFDQPVLLPAGDYVFACRPAAGRTTFQRFTVRSGETTFVAAPD